MRKTVGKIIILFSVLIALTGSISIQARAEQETNLPVIEGTFYDSDQTTPILTVKSAPGATGMYVNEVLSNQALLPLYLYFLLHLYLGMRFHQFELLYFLPLL